MNNELFSTLEPFAYRQNVVNLLLLYRYFHRNWFDKLHSLVLLTLNFTAGTPSMPHTHTPGLSSFPFVFH